MEDILLGSLLGDGSISKCGRGVRYECEQKEENRVYVEWLSTLLSEYNTKVGTRNRTRKMNGYEWAYTSYRVVSGASDELRRMRELFYPDGKKKVSKEWLNLLTERSLAIWYMDDGSYDFNRQTIQIRTDSFGLSEHHLILSFFQEKYGFCPIIAKYGKGKQKKYYLYFPREEAKKFLHLIHTYILPCFAYKKPSGWEQAIALPAAYHKRLNMKKMGEKGAEEILLNSLQRFFLQQEEETFPVVKYLMHKESYSYKAIQRIFGSWEKAFSRAGIPFKTL